MSEEKKKSSVEIVEGFPELGGNFGLVMFPEPLACPKCGSTDFRRLLYGLPAEELSDHEAEYYRLGGCVVRPENWHCEDCGLEW